MSPAISENGYPAENQLHIKAENTMTFLPKEH